jgi:hypothetical protein
VHDVAEAFAAFANEQTATFADTGAAEYPLAAPEGGKEPLRAAFAAHSMGSDHDVYQEGSFRIPAIYLNDWPDRYIHTNRDAAANIDPTKLKRAAFIGAASGYFLAQMGTADQGRVLEQMQIAAWRRHATHMQRALELPAEEVQNLIRREVEYIAAARSSLRPFAGNPGAKADVLAPIMGLLANASPEAAASGEGLLVFTRNPEPKGPMSVFGYDYFEDHAGAAAPRLLGYRGLWGGGAAYAYEALNLVDGRRSAQQIRNALAAEHGPIPLDLVVEYLRALERIGVLRR